MWQYNYAINQNELYHHGVKGMKWGVRRTKEQLGYKTYTPQKGDVTLKRGTKFQRIVTNSNSGITKGVYTSYKNADKDLYKGVLGRMRLSYMAKTGEEIVLKQLTMTAKKDIHLPSKKVRMTEFENLYKKDPDGVLGLINDHEKSRYGRKEKYYDDKGFSKHKESLYEKFNDALSMGYDSNYGNVIKKYYGNLSKKGYDAIPDENDIRLSTFKAQAPIIMFDTVNSIGNTKVRDLNASEVFSAYKRSIGKKTVRDILMQGNIGHESLKADSVAKSKKYAEQLEKDKTRLNENYSITDLANDWGKNRLTSRQIVKVSSKMDKGMSHDEAVAQTIALGNKAVDYVLDKFGL